ncbi:hypothetical protein HNY73_014922 [Argiope bruennichi]|uniref:Uncharacterized protein n=1 Tax=Argiope bruennichi TaxID=94029 RepID=A0A8T0EV26_ARGBR|nr:hypothetical protein HNY73_014922 [Argiope bruennichi]
MHSYLILLFVLRMSFGNGYVLVESGSGSASNPELNPENIKKPLQDIDAPVDDSARVMKDLEDRFTASLIRILEGGDELYKDARYEAIINSLKATMLTATGEIDENYIRKVIESIRKQSAANRKQLDEVMMNKLGFSKSAFQDFMDQFARDMDKSGPPSATGPSRDSASAPNQ